MALKSTARKIRFRSLKITSIGLKYFVFHRVNSFSQNSFGERLCMACQDLGPIFVKIGQILSTRYDILEKSDCESLQKLLDQVPPMSFDYMSLVFKHDFGKTPRELYKEFQEIPIASASIAQVYKAVTHGEHTVAVKVIRPNMGKIIRSDIKILKRLLWIAQIFSSDLRHINGVRIVDELSYWMDNERDFRKEVNNLEMLRTFYTERAEKGDEFAGAVVLPIVYKELCSDNIITMEFMDGIQATRFNAEQAGSEYDVLASLTAALGASVRPWLQNDRLIFHADPHPANVLILKHGKVGLLDFGLVGTFEKSQTKLTRDLCIGIYSQNLFTTVQSMLEICHASETSDTPAFRKDVAEYLKQAKTSGLGYWFMGYIKILIKHRIPFPYEVALFGRGNIVTDGLFETVVPGHSTLEIMGGEMRSSLYQEMFENILNTDFGPVLLAVSKQVKKTPNLIAKLIEKYGDSPVEFVRDIRKIIYST